MKKIIFALSCLALSCGVLASNASAATSWSACTPTQIGPYGSFVRLKLSGCNIDPTAGKSWMTLSTTGTDQMMATILTAMSLGKPVSIGSDGTTDSEGYKYATAVILSNQ